nr:ankyrin repeat domain-containing protein [uncultured Desulfuromonas sp.]
MTDVKLTPISASVLEALCDHWDMVMADNTLDIPLEYVEQLNAHGEAPIHIAAWKGSVTEVEWLLENGSHVNHRVVCELTPLHYAYMGGKAKNIQALLEAGADPTARTRLGLLPAGDATADALLAERSLSLYGY